VGAIVELQIEKLSADPSQGSHFFQNITSRRVHYVTVRQFGADRFDWNAIEALPSEAHGDMVRHARLEHPLMVKTDGRSGCCAMLLGT
jgi:hypothetical protein